MPTTPSPSAPSCCIGGARHDSANELCVVQSAEARRRPAGLHYFPASSSRRSSSAALGAELLAATNGDLTSFSTADRLAGIAGLTPVPRGSGRISGNLKRPRRYDRRLLRVFYVAANNSIKTCPESRNYHDRKRSEGKRHSQAILCLARRRLNVLWAMQRDNTSYQPGVPRRRKMGRLEELDLGVACGESASGITNDLQCVLDRFDENSHTSSY
jgi:Transposase IS116/IS110/IS902 family